MNLLVLQDDLKKECDSRTDMQSKMKAAEKIGIGSSLECGDSNRSGFMNICRRLTMKMILYQ